MRHHIHKLGRPAQLSRRPTGRIPMRIARELRVAVKLFKELETKASRDKNIHDAHVKYGYTLKEIADHLKIHYTTVSKVVSKREKEQS